VNIFRLQSWASAVFARGWNAEAAIRTGSKGKFGLSRLNTWFMEMR
jgi:hypothetical protein